MLKLVVTSSAADQPAPRHRRRRAGAETPPGTVVTYLRVSTSEQALSGLGIDAQRATVAAYAERKGLTIVEEYCDEGISAKSLKGRPPPLPHLKQCGREKPPDCWSPRWTG